MSEKLPDGWNRHHTLYYRRKWDELPIQRRWRNHPVMIVPMLARNQSDPHPRLHREVPPVSGIISSDSLAQVALAKCWYIQAEGYTALESFTSVRDELYRYYQRNQYSKTELAREALKFSEQFSHQLEFMTELPILGSN